MSLVLGLDWCRVGVGREGNRPMTCDLSLLSTFEKLEISRKKEREIVAKAD